MLDRLDKVEITLEELFMFIQATNMLTEIVRLGLVDTDTLHRLNDETSQSLEEEIENLFNEGGKLV